MDDAGTESGQVRGPRTRRARDVTTRRPPERAEAKTEHEGARLGQGRGRSHHEEGHDDEDRALDHEGRLGDEVETEPMQTTG